MQFNYNNRISAKASVKKKIVKYLLCSLVLLFVLFILSKFNFPAPQEKIKKNISNEIIKLK